MKQFTGFYALLCAAMLLTMISCNDTSSSSNSTTDSSVVVDTQPSTESTQSSQSNINTTPENILITRYKVSDYTKWRAVYDSRDSMRTANGLRNYVIGRGVRDTNMVMVALKTDDVAKAKTFTQSAALRSAMEKGHVVGTPKFTFTKVLYQDMAQNLSDLRSMNFLTVKDWDSWRKSFEEGRQNRLDNGVTDRAFGHDADDNHKVILVVAINDSAKAEAYWKSDEIRKRRADAGVVGEVEGFVYRVVQKY